MMATGKWDDSRFSVRSNQPSREQDAKSAAVSSSAAAGGDAGSGVRSTDNLATDDILTSDTVTPRGTPGRSTRRSVSGGNRDITDVSDSGGASSSRGFRRDLEDDRSQAASDYWDDN